MKKKMVIFFCAGFLFAVIAGMMAKTSVAVEDASFQPLIVLISGVFNGIQFGLLIPFAALLDKRQKRQGPYFAVIFSLVCGLAVGEGVILGVHGLLLVGLLFAVSKIVVLCAAYLLTCRWWKKQQV